MYNSKLAVAIKSRGKVLREVGENVYLPFGSEYSVFVKNLNTVRALVKVEIDGRDVGDGTKFIVPANSSVDLERFIANGNMDQGNRFKFIERTDSIEEHRGVGIEDGIIRVEFNFEKVYEPPRYYPNTWYTSNTFDTFGGSGTYTTSHTVSNNVRAASANVNTVDLSNVSLDVSNDAGITVEGSISDQQFVEGSWFATEATTHAIVLKLLGETPDNVQVRKPVTVKTKAICKTCGHRNKATAKFCSECGTSLQLV